MRIRTIVAGLTTLLSSCWCGCATMPEATLPFASRQLRESVSPNPLVVPSGDFELVWRDTIRVVDEYFDIATENRLSGTIVTDPRMGSTIFEPWLGDSVGFRERWESTLQTIRRFAQITIKPDPTGGFAVKVEVYKELEDLVKPDRQTGGRAVFNNVFPINRTREVVGPIPAPLMWIPRGRDHKLEQVILARLRYDLGL